MVVATVAAKDARAKFGRKYNLRKRPPREKCEFEYGSVLFGEPFLGSSLSVLMKLIVQNEGLSLFCVRTLTTPA